MKKKSRRRSSKKSDKKFSEKFQEDFKLGFKFLVLAACFMLLLAGFSLGFASQVYAEPKPLSLEQIEQTFAEEIKKGSSTVTFTAPANFTTAQIQNALKNAAKSQDRLIAGSIQFQKQTNSASAVAKYTIKMSKDALMKVTRLKSEKAAVKAAVKALKNSKYSTNYYSDTSYYDIFNKILQQHPEYNYNTVVWRSTNGAYGYQRGNGLTKEQQDSKVKAADAAAKKAVGKCIEPKMSGKQKAKAIHNYLLKNCSYDESTALAGNKYQDAFTAYGALVNGSAVCQGYAAAFNLMAQKCGLQSMAVCGRAGGVPHAWTYAKLGSKDSYIDCTWDDTMTGETKISYEYFNVGAEKMREQHVWKEADFPSGDIKYSKYFM